MKKWTLTILLVVATVALIAVALVQPRTSVGTVGIAAGSALPGFAPRPDTPEHALTILLHAVQRRDWSQASSVLAAPNGISPKEEDQSLAQEWIGSDGSLRTYSSLEGFDLWPLHATPDDAQIRARLRWTTPVGPVEDVRDFHLIHSGDVWNVQWKPTEPPSVPAQVIPVTYLRWDLVSGTAQNGDQWGSHNVDAPHVRIISMNAVNSAQGVVVMGEVENEDTIPAFVNVNATLVDAAGNAIDEENSFDKIAHVLLPKQVSPYRIDFPGLDLARVKNVRMDVKAALVPASADPVIGVMNQKIEQDVQGNPVLQGELLNQSGRTVNIPHVIASFSDGNGRVIWVADGYVDNALLPQQSQPFAVQIPRNLAAQVKSFHVVVNQYSFGRS
jgi:hypothetical protein